VSCHVGQHQTVSDRDEVYQTVSANYTVTYRVRQCQTLSFYVRQCRVTPYQTISDSVRQCDVMSDNVVSHCVGPYRTMSDSVGQCQTVSPRHSQWLHQSKGTLLAPRWHTARTQNNPQHARSAGKAAERLVCFAMERVTHQIRRQSDGDDAVECKQH
jgi:hypothetical protein